jgi:hypothetical protein
MSTGVYVELAEEQWAEVVSLLHFVKPLLAGEVERAVRQQRPAFNVGTDPTRPQKYCPKCEQVTARLRGGSGRCLECTNRYNRKVRAASAAAERAAAGTKDPSGECTTACSHDTGEP